MAAGETLILPAVTQRVLRGLPAVARDFDRLDRPDALTPRETEVPRLVAGGYSNREIARALENRLDLTSHRPSSRIQGWREEE